MPRRSVYPFTAIVGQERMKRALILNAVNPNIGGVLIRGERGTAKSTAARALAALLPDIEVVADCRFNCDPRRPESYCDECRDRVAKGELRPQLLDRFALSVDVHSISAPRDRMAILQRHIGYDENSEKFRAEWLGNEQALGKEIADGRDLVDHVAYSERDLFTIANL